MAGQPGQLGCKSGHHCPARDARRRPVGASEGASPFAGLQTLLHASKIQLEDNPCQTLQESLIRLIWHWRIKATLQASICDFADLLLLFDRSLCSRQAIDLGQL